MLLLERREFIGLVAAAAVFRQPHGPDLHVSIPRGDMDVRRGAEMSVDEAQRSAAMFGGSIDLAEQRGDMAGTAIAITVGIDPAAIHMMVRPTPASCGRLDFGMAPLTGLAWHDGLIRFGADTLNKRFRARFQTPMTPAAWCAWF